MAETDLRPKLLEEAADLRKKVDDLRDATMRLQTDDA